MDKQDEFEIPEKIQPDESEPTALAFTKGMTDDGIEEDFPAIGTTDEARVDFMKKVLSERDFGSIAKFPQPEFAFVIFDIDLGHDTENVHIDSIWTNNDDAVKRMKILEKAENAFLKKSPRASKYGKARLSGYSERFPFAEELVIRRETEDGTGWEPTFGIFCKKAFFNKEELLQDFKRED